MIAPMMPGKASAAFVPNLPASDAKALSLFLSHSFMPFSSLGGGLPAEPAVPPGRKASTRMLIAIPIVVSMEVIVIPCSLNSVRIFSADGTFLSSTLVFVSLKLVIWLTSLLFRISMLSCLTFSSSFSSAMYFWVSSHCTSVLSRIL